MLDEFICGKVPHEGGEIPSFVIICTTARGLNADRTIGMGLFKWKQRSKSVGSDDVDNASHPPRNRAMSADASIHLDPSWDTYSLSPTQSLTDASIALSETDTLLQEHRNGHELQEAYEDNFTSYHPFLLRRLRLEAYRTTEESAMRGAAEQFNESHKDDDDVSTVLNESIRHTLTILGKEISNFTLKRKFIIASEFMKSAQYIFPCEELFELFKELRRNKNSKDVFVYTSNNEVRKIDVDGKQPEGSIIDSRQHIIPLDYKLQGLGLPLFKVLVPYLSSFKKNTPYIVFKRFREKPTRPSSDATKEESFETYTYCTVYSKHFQKVKRVTFQFTVEENGEKRSFTVYLFMNNFKPFADFTYQGTKFRVLGTPIITTLGLNYNPCLKLLIVDRGKPSLCDNIINKRTNFEFLKILKKKKASCEETEDPTYVQYDEDVPSTHINPYPDPNNPLLQEDTRLFRDSNMNRIQYISDDMPPFGAFKDSILNEKSNILPRKYSDSGKIELYQDRRQAHGNIQSTLLLDTDTLVLQCVLATIREIAIKNAGNAINTASHSRVATMRGTSTVIGAGLFV